MTPLDVLESFDGTTAKVALVATYEFDPLFFERRVLRKRGFNGAERILVLMDAGRYRELLSEGLPVSGFNGRYRVVPVDRHPFVFHTKLYLFIGEQRVTGIVGSNGHAQPQHFEVELTRDQLADLGLVAGQSVRLTSSRLKVFPAEQQS
jgi:hypothetical protein